VVVIRFDVADRERILALIFVKLFIKKKFRALGGGEPWQGCGRAINLIDPSLRSG
jgi:hypothetical protein